MDAILLVSVAILTTMLSRNLISLLSVHDTASGVFVHVALGLCFSLLSLTVLDACPWQWNMLVSSSSPSQSIRIHTTSTEEPSLSSSPPLIMTTMYRFLLWGIATHVVIVGPFQLGCWLFQSSKSCSFTFFQRRQHWIIRLMAFLLQKCFWILSLPLVIFRWKQQRRIIMDREVIPLHTANSNTNSNSFKEKWTHWNYHSLLGGLLGILGALCFLQTLGPFVMETKDHPSVLARLISSLSAVGILISALLNGFGSVSMPYTCLRGLYLKEVSVEAIAAAERELEKAKVCLAYRQEEEPKPSLAAATTLLQQQQSGNRSTFADLGDAILQRKKQIQAEMQFLHQLIAEMTEDINEMRQARVTAAMARTTTGRIQSYIGIVFSVILLVRLAGAFYAIVISTTTATRTTWHENGGDPVTTALLWLTGHRLVAQEYYNALSQFTSLILTAFLSVSQVRFFLKVVSAVHRHLSPWYQKCLAFETTTKTTVTSTATSATTATTSTAQSVVASPDAWAILVTQLMTCYCLACGVLTKKMLPIQYQSNFSAALEGVLDVRPYPVHMTFTMAALVSASILGVLHGIQRQNTHRYHLVNTTTSTDNNVLDP